MIIASACSCGGGDDGGSGGMSVYSMNAHTVFSLPPFGLEHIWQRDAGTWQRGWLLCFGWLGRLAGCTALSLLATHERLWRRRQAVIAVVELHSFCLAVVSQRLSVRPAACGSF